MLRLWLYLGLLYTVTLASSTLEPSTTELDSLRAPLFEEFDPSKTEIVRGNGSESDGASSFPDLKARFVYTVQGIGWLNGNVLKCYLSISNISTSNVSVRIVEKSRRTRVLNGTIRNNENNAINFNKEGFRFAGNTIADTDLRPAQPSLAHAISQMVLEPFPRNFPGGDSIMISRLGPMRLKSTKMTFSYPPGQGPWTKGAIVQAVTILHRYFQQHPTAEELDMWITSPAGLRIFFQVFDVRYISCEIQYAETPIEADSPKIKLAIYLDDPLDTEQSVTVIRSVHERIMSERPRELIEPGKTVFGLTRDVVLRLSMPSGTTAHSADITWDQLRQGLETAFGVMEEQIGHGKYAVMLGTLTTGNGDQQCRLIFAENTNNARPTTS